MLNQRVPVSMLRDVKSALAVLESNDGCVGAGRRDEVGVLEDIGVDVRGQERYH